MRRMVTTNDLESLKHFKVENNTLSWIRFNDFSNSIDYNNNNIDIRSSGEIHLNPQTSIHLGDAFYATTTPEIYMFGGYNEDADDASTIAVVDENGFEVQKWDDDKQDYLSKMQVGQNIILVLPTSDPQVAGALWNDNGTLKVSAGE